LGGESMEPKTILPADTYTVINRTILTDFERKTIISLYEPIIGVNAVSLYFTLWQDVDRNGASTNKYNHHHLMAILKLGLEPLTLARRTLESMGLLRSFYKAGDINDYIYEIYSPLSPYEFFNHPIFNVVLYNNVGQTEYEALVKYYKKQPSNPKDYEEVTSSLDVNFKSISMTSLTNEQDMQNLQKTESIGPNIDEKYIDFDLLISSLPKNLVNEKAFNKRTRNLINSLAFVYDLDTLKMSELLRMVINENGVIDKETLRLNARKYYQFNNSGSLPTLIYRTQPEHLKTPEGDTSNRGKMIYIFENTSPYDFLRSKYHGSEPTARDLKLLEYLAIDLELSPSVINVLIDYVLKSNNNKLTQAYVETIAGQWKRMNIQTADAAMRTAEKEHKKNKTKVFTNKTSKKEAPTPIWFNEQQEVKEISDEDKQELESMLKEFR
jgi:replication initiation and membrane attachment protein